MFLSFSIHFLSCCIHFLSFCFHVLSCSVAVYQSYRSSKTDLLKPSWTGQVGIRPNAHFFFIFRYRFCYRLAIGLEACAGCHLQASWTCAFTSSWLFFNSYRFLGRQCVGSVKLQAKLKWNAPGYYTVPFFCGRLRLWEQYVRRHYVKPNEWHFVEDQARGIQNPISCASVRLNHNVWANKSNALWFMVQSTVFHGWMPGQPPAGGPKNVARNAPRHWRKKEPKEPKGASDGTRHASQQGFKEKKGGTMGLCTGIWIFNTYQCSWEKLSGLMCIYIYI